LAVLGDFLGLFEDDKYRSRCEITFSGRTDVLCTPVARLVADDVALDEHQLWSAMANLVPPMCPCRGSAKRHSCLGSLE
jgi:hypothetical protein